jgi:hypothetical protein
MSRIRSVHPGFFKDERLVQCSAFARLLFIGLGVEADDKGIFEWKPLTLKMTVFPADNVDVPALLEELAAADAIMRFEANGRPYGAIRNFRKYQKPKTPNDIYPMPDCVAEYVSFPPKGEMQIVDAPPLPPKAEKSLLMEDGGGKREEGEQEPPNPQGGEVDEVEREFEESLWRDFPRHKNSRHSMRFEDDRSDKRPMPERLRFVPHLSTWINQRGWEAELETA